MDHTMGKEPIRQQLCCRSRRLLVTIAAVLVLVCSSHALAASPSQAGTAPSPSPEPVVEQQTPPFFPVTGYTPEQIRAFQLSHGLIATGIADDYTLAAMDQAYAQQGGD